MSKRFRKVEDKADLVRDMSSRAIINTNDTAYKKAKNARNARLKDRQRIDTLEKDVADIKQDIQEILNLLRK